MDILPDDTKIPEQKETYTVDDMLNTVRTEFPIDCGVVMELSPTNYVVKENPKNTIGIIFRIIDDPNLIKVRMDFYDRTRTDQGLITLIAISTVNKDSWGHIKVDRVNEAFLTPTKVNEIKNFKPILNG
ncbi:hypothetical protein KC669_04460 [Candidatus Dojkabacteria bacterium]|uniref:Uncharacterized protein n=1 Tax=Candidatus Dojkabacteria bacterium TaxID=2099670 RepID=A0A955LBT5_9BACT|nr:hypothetical protein [Candidatus Dojkabacteria bacterium]